MFSSLCMYFSINVCSGSTYTVVNVSTILTDPLSLPVLGCFCFFRSLDSGRLFVSKHIQGSGATATNFGSGHLKGENGAAAEEGAEEHGKEGRELHGR